MSPNGPVCGLLTDLYELTMAAGYYAAGKSEEKAAFELSVRHLPPNRNYIIAAGLAQAVEYLTLVQFTEDDIAYLRSLPQFAHTPEGFYDRLRRFRFTGDLLAVPEGTPVFSGEPVLTVRAPLIEAQIAETYLLSMISFQSLVATKAARIVQTARGRAVVEFGTRRAHSPMAGVVAARAAYIGGCVGTSNALAGKLYGIPVYGTAAHSWVQAFPSEEAAFRQLQELLQASTVYIVDTYDTLEGARRAASLGQPLWGVRLDSGDLLTLSRQVRAILDEAGLKDAKIMASGDLNEYRIQELVRQGAPIDAFGVGTELVTSADSPRLGAIYKLVELESGGIRRYTAKFSEDKATYPGTKQIYRFKDYDLIACSWESPPAGGAESLLRLVLLDGKPVQALPTVSEVRDYAARQLAALPPPCRRLDSSWTYRIEYSDALTELAKMVRNRVREAVP
ncbi:MAG: nicotinate phosphoribosyltransferase [Bryobacteraceae bacterium]